MKSMSLEWVDLLFCVCEIHEFGLGFVGAESKVNGRQGKMLSEDCFGI